MNESQQKTLARRYGLKASREAILIEASVFVAISLEGMWQDRVDLLDDWTEYYLDAVDRNRSLVVDLVDQIDAYLN